MVRQVARQIQARLGWPLIALIGLTVVGFSVATAAVMQQRGDDAATVSVAPEASRQGGTSLDLAAPEERMKSEAGSASAPAPSGGGAAGVPAGDSAALAEPRDVIRTGSVDLEVKSVSDAFEQVRTIASGAGGFVADSMFIGSGDNHSARLTLRIPAARFGEVVTQLRGIASEVRTVSSSARDVTGEVTDLEATLRNLRAVEAQYATLLGRAVSIGDVLQVQERLNQVRLQIDRTEARRALIQSQTEMSTLSVALMPEGTAAKNSADGFRASASEAWEASLATLENIATAAIVVLVYSWWIVPLLVLAAVLLRRWAARRVPSEAPHLG